MIERTCKCGNKYQAKEADIKRGWGLSCSKSCAAKKRTIREAKGNFKIAKASEKYRKESESEWDGLDDDPSWDAHKTWR